MQPDGVHGRSPGRPLASSPADTGVRPSTSLAGSISQVRPLPSIWPGVGSWSRIPDTRGSSLSSASRRSTSSCGVSAASRWSNPTIPTSLVAFCLPPTYTAEAASSPTRTVASPGGSFPAATHAATSAATSRRTSSAIAFPSMICALIGRAI